MEFPVDDRMTLRQEIACDTARILSEWSPPKPEGDMRWVFALLIVASFGSCAAVNATEDLALAACYEAGFSPSECER